MTKKQFLLNGPYIICIGIIIIGTIADSMFSYFSFKELNLLNNSVATRYLLKDINILLLCLICLIMYSTKRILEKTILMKDAIIKVQDEAIKRYIKEKYTRMIKDKKIKYND